MSIRGMSWLRCPKVKEDLKLVEMRLKDAIEHDDTFVLEICTHLIHGGGKRLRPALILLAGEFGDRDDSRLMSSAVAMELMHVATLYHDDIADEATARRGLPSVNATWGNMIAAFAGDLLLAKSTELFAAAGDEVNQAVNWAMKRVWEGQMREIGSTYNLELDEASYFEIIEKKTAAFYELPCRIGALVSDASPARLGILADYGRYLGIAFQLTDDVMDIVADETLMREPPGADLREGVYTLPVIYALGSEDTGRDRLRAILIQTELEEDAVDEALTILRRSRSILRTMDTARDFVQLAKGRIGLLPDGTARESLYSLADFVIDRVDLDSCLRLGGNA